MSLILVVLFIAADSSSLDVPARPEGRDEFGSTLPASLGSAWPAPDSSPEASRILRMDFSGSSLSSDGTRQERGDRWSIEAGVVVRALRGSTVVRENDIQGTRISLHRDLGMEIQEGGQVRFTYDGPRFLAMLNIEYLEGSGRNPEHRDFFFNGYQFASADPIHLLTHFLTVRLLFESKAFADAGDE